MDFGRGLSFVRQDPDWLVKTLLGSVISFVPILNFAATGYSMDVIRQIVTGRETPLPKWGENFGDRWVRGLIATVVGFIYVLPLVLIGCGWGIVALAGNAARPQSNGQATANAPVLAALCSIPIFFVAGLLLGTLAMVAQARYAVTNDFGSAMRFSSIVAEWRSGLGRWLSVLAMTLAIAIPFGIVGLLTCGLGYLLVFYLILVQSHWIAQAYRESAGVTEPATT